MTTLEKIIYWSLLAVVLSFFVWSCGYTSPAARLLDVSAIMPFQRRYASTVRETRTETYHQHNESFYDPRSLRIGLTWRFGKTSINLKHARKTEVDDKL